MRQIKQYKGEISIAFFIIGIILIGINLGILFTDSILATKVTQFFTNIIVLVGIALAAGSAYYYGSLKISPTKLHKIVGVAVILVLICIPMFWSFSIRSTPAELPFAERSAESSIRNQISTQYAQQINSQFPFLPQSEKDKQINDAVNQYVSDNQDSYNAQVDALADNFRSRFQDANGQTYLVALDPYFFFRFVRNILDHGYAGEYLNADGVQVTNYINAPTEKPTVGFQKQFHVQFSVLWHKFINIFKPTPLETTFFFVPVFIMSITAIPAFFLGRRFGGNISGFIAASIIVLHPSILTRTIGGFSDTDAYNVFFPVLVIWLLVEALSAKSWVNKLVLTALSAISMGFFAYAWVGYWFLFIIIGISFAIAVLFQIIHAFIAKDFSFKQFHEQVLGKIVIVGVLFLVVTSVSVFIAADHFVLQRAYQNAFSDSGSIDDATLTNLWPNVFTTVAELNNGNVNDIINSTTQSSAARFAFFTAIVGCLILLIPSMNVKIRTQRVTYIYGVLLLVWMIITIYMTLAGIRFGILFIPAFAFAFAAAIGRIHQIVKEKGAKWFEIPKWPITIAFIVLAILIIMPFHATAQNIAEQTTPSMSDGFYNALINIKDNSEPDAIISSWWDFGHQFITIGERGATADGGSQNTPQAVWLGQALVSNDPEEFVGISRMLNCDSNKGYEKIYEVIPTAVDAVPFTKEVVSASKEDARVLLESNGFSQAQATNVLESTHCDDVVESFWIASSDMVGKAPVWGHFGSWDFARAQAWRLRKDEPAFIEFATEKLDLSEDEAKRTRLAIAKYSEAQGNEWISPWPNYRTSGFSNCQENNETIICPLGVQVSQTIIAEAVEFDKEYTDIKVIVRENNERGFASPEKFSVGNSEGFTTYEFEDAIPSFGIAIKEGANYQIMLAHSDLVDSMYTRMFFFNGVGSEEYLTLFDDRTTITGMRIATFKRAK